VHFAPKHISGLLDSIPHLVWTMGTEGRLEWANAAWSRLVGDSVGADVAASLALHLHPDDRERRSEQWRCAARSCEPYEIEYRVSAPDGALHWHLERGTPARSRSEEPITGWAVISTPIEQRKKTEEELQASLRERDDFLAVLLHELRNPLAPIANALELLERGAGEVAVVKLARATVHRQLRQITRLVDDLLDVSRAVRGRLALNVRPIDLDEVVETAVESARPMIECRNQILTTSKCSSPIHVTADPVRLAQVLTNLLVNASKYTQTGGHISVIVGQDDSAVWMRVRDDGIGIAREMLPQVFQLYTQADPDSRSSGGGLGVGLAVARQLIELHGGTISAHSEGVGRGTELEIRLPRH